MPIEGFSFLFSLNFATNLRKYSWKMFYFFSDLDSIEINEKESWILHDFPMVCPPHDNFLTLTCRDYCPYGKISCLVIVKMIILKRTPCTRSILKLTIVSLSVRKFWIEPAHHVRCSGPWVLHSRSELPLCYLCFQLPTQHISNVVRRCEINNFPQDIRLIRYHRGSCGETRRIE